MQAVVLTRRDFREYDQIISLYTKEKGKLEALARGVKKITSKNAAHLEPFSLILVEVVPGKEINHLTKVVPALQFSSIRKSFWKSTAAIFVLDCVNNVIEVGEADAVVWKLIISWLKYLEMHNEFASILIDACMLKLFQCLGVAPRLNQCVLCEKTYQSMGKEEIISRHRPGLYFLGGGIICASCNKKKQAIGERISECGLQEIGLLQILLLGDWQKIMALNLSLEYYVVIHALVYEFVVYHSERKIHDWKQF